MTENEGAVGKTRKKAKAGPGDALVELPEGFRGRARAKLGIGLHPVGRDHGLALLAGAAAQLHRVHGLEFAQVIVGGHGAARACASPSGVSGTM